MHVYLDTADKKEIGELMKWGSFAGITTNPIILKKADLDVWDAIKNLSLIFSGDFFVQTWGDSAKEMEANAVKIAEKLGKRAIIKVPITENGLKAIYNLSNNGIWTAATALFTKGQAVLATEAGANFVIPFYNRIAEAGKDAIKIISQVCAISNGRKNTKVLVAILKNVSQVYSLPQDVFAITISPTLAHELLESDLTDKAVIGFSKASSEE